MDLQRGLLHWCRPNAMTNLCWGGRRAALHLFGRDLRPQRHRLCLLSSHSQNSKSARERDSPCTCAGRAEADSTQPSIASFQHATGAHPHSRAREPYWPPQAWRPPPSVRVLLARAVDSAGSTVGSTQDLTVMARPNVLVGVSHCGRDPLDRVAFAALAHDKLAAEQRLRVGARGRARERQPGQRDSGEHVEHLHSARGRAEPHAPAERRQYGNVRASMCNSMPDDGTQRPDAAAEQEDCRHLTSLYIQRQCPQKKFLSVALHRSGLPSPLARVAPRRREVDRYTDEHNHHPPSVAGLYFRMCLSLPRLLAARSLIPAPRCRVVRPPRPSVLTRRVARD